jgi:hypothetical protein
MMPKRSTCQVILFVVWFCGLIAAVIIYQRAFLAFKDNPLLLFPGPGAAPADWHAPIGWEETMSAKYQAPLAAVYTPWLLVMVGAILAGAQRNSSDRISVIIFAATLVLSVLFNGFLSWILWKYLYELKPLDNEIPTNQPLVALLVSIIGAFVTYNFPKSDDLPPAPHAEPPAAPTA